MQPDTPPRRDVDRNPHPILPQPVDRPASPDRRYVFVHPLRFLDPLPPHLSYLRDPYHPPVPVPEPEEEPEYEPAGEHEYEPEEDHEDEPEDEHDDAADSDDESDVPDEGPQPYEWDEEESDGTDGLDDAIVVDPPYPIRPLVEVTPFPFTATYREPGEARRRHTPRMTVPPVCSADVLRTFVDRYPGCPDPYTAGPSCTRRDLGEYSGDTRNPAFQRQPYYSQGPGETFGEIRHRITQLEARAASVDEIYGPLISDSFMHGIHIKVLEQDSERLEAIRLEAKEEERLGAKGDRKRKGPAM